MSFEVLVPPPRAAKADVPVRVGVSVYGETAPSRLCVLVKREIVDQVSKGATSATVELGKAEDRHLLRIRLNGKGDFSLSPTPKGGPLRIKLPPNVRWPVCGIKAQAAAYKIGKGYIDVELPAWAFDAGEKSAIEGRGRG